MDTPLKVLLVDDVPENMTLLRKVLQRAGYVIICAASGEDALECFMKERPDVVLMDMLLPGMDGCETTVRLRELDAGRWVPIIFVSAMIDNADIVRALEAGGDDYIGKPVDLSLLLAKMRSMQRIAAMQRRLAVTAQALEKRSQEAEEEEGIAHDVMERMIESSSIEDPGLQIFLAPARHFNGDLLIANKSFNGVLYLLHADSMGHGLAAALPLLPLAQIFHAMAMEGHSVAAMAKEMNSQLRRLLPVGRFVSAALVRVDRANRLVEVWNGGNPAPLLVNAETRKVVGSFRSTHLPLGVLDPASFDAGTCVVQSSEACKLVLFSDGVTDALSETGEEFGEAGVMRAIAQCGDVYANLTAALQAHIAWGGEQDDISLLVLGG